ncbi:hypothetical protein GKZ90_0019845 [Flavobacterium sp. MC2016-06]|uniref:hypothetical protein n=1 Tax=Flavobacterium sp. MC2016-06 TaxID=2676308 RepID=UPI0012BA7953|nr:hypothetical protein [Flavobacterium sp. MC2016-06]MBU3861379.1 hypothetical protein [Flavobacterium sp. MC2016-06]
MRKIDDDIIIYTTKRPFWHYLIAIPLYVLIVPLLYKMVELFYDRKGLNGLQFIVTMFFVLVCAAGLTFTKRIYTNSKFKDIRFNFKLFGFRLMKDVVFENIRYISVHRNNRDRDFEIKIWLTETKKETISIFFDLESAFKFATNIAVGLDINLLDATEKGNFKWIEKENLK